MEINDIWLYMNNHDIPCRSEYEKNKNSGVVAKAHRNMERATMKPTPTPVFLKPNAFTKPPPNIPAI